MSGQGPGGTAGRPFTKPWSAVTLSVLGSAAAGAAGGGVCALIYPVLTGLWSVLVLSVLVGCICCVFSWTLTKLDQYQLGSPVTHLRDVPDPGFHMGNGVAVLNGIMAMLAVIWSLS